MLERHDVTEIINFTKTTIKLMMGFSNNTKFAVCSIVVTYAQFNSNIRVLYGFFGLFKKYLKILENT